MRAGLVLSALVAMTALSACDRKPEAAAPSAPVAAAAPTERVGPVTWNAQAGAFQIAGAPLRGIKQWTFDGSTDGFTGLGSKLEPAQPNGLMVTVADPSIRSPKGLAVSGAEAQLVIVRLTRVGAGAPWDGALYYTTGGHGEGIQWLGKPISGADPKLNETVTLVYDMAHQTIGAPDWTASTIDQLRFDLEDKPGGKFLIHQVAITDNPNPAALAPAPAASPSAPPAGEAPSPAGPALK